MVDSKEYRCLYVDPGETCAVSFIEDGKEDTLTSLAASSARSEGQSLSSGT